MHSSAFHPYARPEATKQTIPSPESTLRNLYQNYENLRVPAADFPPYLSPEGPVRQERSTPPESAQTGSERSRRKRTTFSLEQAARLEKEYLNDCYMAREKRIFLARELELSENQVKTWFQNRRAKDKREKKESPRPSSRKSSPDVDVKPLESEKSPLASPSEKPETCRFEKIGAELPPTPPLHQGPFADYQQYLSLFGLNINSPLLSMINPAQVTPTMLAMANGAAIANVYSALT